MAAGGDADAKRFLGTFVEFAHVLDDVVDKEPVSDAELMRAVIRWTAEVSENPFFQRNRSGIMAVIVVSVNAWIDSNRWSARPDIRERIAADVLKGMYHEVVYLVAFLCGGWERMRVLSELAREYDFEPQK